MANREKVKKLFKLKRETLRVDGVKEVRVWRETPLWRNHKKVIAYEVKLPAGKLISRRQVNDEVEAKKQEWEKEFPGKYDVMLTTNDVTLPQMNGWRSGRWRCTNQAGVWFRQMSEYTAMVLGAKEDDPFFDEKHISGYVLYVSEHAAGGEGSDAVEFMFQGGCGLNNDCLWETLCSLGVKMPWKNAALFKKACGVGRNDKVPVSCMAAIEEALPEWRIEVVVDEGSAYNSGKQCKYVARLTGQNSHYEPSHDYMSYQPEKMRGTEHEKLIVMYWKEGESVREVTAKKTETTPLAEWNKKFFFSLAKPEECPVIYIEGDKLKAGSTVEAMYADYIKDVVDIKAKTKGRINMFKTGSITKTALEFFASTISTIAMENIPLLEQQWIDEAYMGGFTFARKGYEGEGHKCDVTSFYPWIMSRNETKFPVRAGEFVTLSADVFLENPVFNFFNFGIYRCRVIGAEPEYFKTNDANKYTHTDLQCAQDLGYKLELIEDGQANALIYCRSSLVTGRELFKTYVDTLFPIKCDGNKTAKKLLNTMSGLLGRHDIHDTTVLDGDKFDLTHHVETELNPMYDENNELIGYSIKSYNKMQNIFKYPFARASPFLTAYGRRDIHKIMSSFGYMPQIVQIHTDGFVTKNKLPLKYGGGELGSLKYEKHSDKIRVNHVNSVVDLNKKTADGKYEKF